MKMYCADKQWELRTPKRAVLVKSKELQNKNKNADKNFRKNKYLKLSDKLYNKKKTYKVIRWRNDLIKAKEK